MQSISPFLWFDGTAEQAARFYEALFPDAAIEAILRQDDGSVLMVIMHLQGQSVALLNGGSHYQLTPGFSFVVPCDDQEEIDRLWEAFGGGGQTMACGWVTDRFGVTWQVMPAPVMGWLKSPEHPGAQRMMQALWGMEKLDFAQLQAAYEGHDPA